MIITKTPFRISFVGGGSDFESFYRDYTGSVLSTTINKYMYLSSHKFFDRDKLRIKYSKTETVGKLSELNHPIVREVLEKFNIYSGLEISSNADVPAGTGLGSSSAFTVGLLHNMYTVKGVFASKARLAEDACDIEINRLKEPIGKQDQYAAAFGGLNIFRFHTSGQVNVEPIHLPKEVYSALQSNLLMYYTGDQRTASSILTEQKANMQSCHSVEILREIVALVDELRDALFEGALEQFGRTLHRGWMLKQQLASKISNSRINDLYELALKHGATGGKLLGAGGGGFLLLYCDKSKQDKLRAALWSLRELSFKLENEGSKLIHVDDEY